MSLKPEDAPKTRGRKRTNGGIMQSTFLVTDDNKVVDSPKMRERKISVGNSNTLSTEKVDTNTPSVSIERVESKTPKGSPSVKGIFDKDLILEGIDSPVQVEKKKRVKFSVFRKENTPTPMGSFLKTDKTPEQLFKERQVKKKEKKIPLYPGDINNQEEGVMSSSGILFFHHWVKKEIFIFYVFLNIS